MFPAVQKACHDLLFENSHEKAPPLYSLDLRLNTLEPGILSGYYTSKPTLKNIQLILRYLFTTAHKYKFPMITHENGDEIANKSIINKVTILYCKINPQSIVGKRTSGITHQTQVALATNIILARFLSQKETSKDLILTAWKADCALVGFMLNACNQSDNGKFYDPTKDKSLKEAWTQVFRYLDKFVVWKSVSKCTLDPPPFVGMIRSLIVLIEKSKDDLKLIPQDLTKRMECCAIILESARKRVTKKYPENSTMSMKHPCDSYLRSIMGYPTSSVDLRLYSIHDILSKKCKGYVESRVDPLTMYITSRRYHTTTPNGEYEPDRKPTFFGGIPYISNEAMIHSMFCGGTATMSSGYDPLSTSTMPLVSSYPCKWFPAVQFGLNDALEHAYWNGVEDAVNAKLYGIVEATIVIIRFNFVSCFNAIEKETSKKMLHPQWCATGKTPNKLEGFANSCKEFMRGPVLSCSGRFGTKCGDLVMKDWEEEETKLWKYMEDPSVEKPGSVIVSVLQCMEKCSKIIKLEFEMNRRKNFDRILNINGGGIPSLRLLLFSRTCSKIQDPDHPFKQLIEKHNKCLSLTLHAPMFQDDKLCKEFIVNSKSMLPLTEKWVLSSENTTPVGIAKRICSWILDEMLVKGTGDIGTPETMAPSLPFLDKISIICALSCAFLESMMVVSPSEEAWDLFRDGIDLEMYEWDSSFVERLLSRVSDTERIQTPFSKDYVSSILFFSMIGGGGTSENISKDLDRFNSILKNTHFHEMGMWFWNHIKVYGVVYEALGLVKE